MPPILSSILALVLLTVSGCVYAQEQKVLQIYNWADYIEESLLDKFESETGIQVVYNMYESDEMLDAKLLAGYTGYDIIGMADMTVQNMLPLSLFQPLNRDQLPNWRDLDPELMQRMAYSDPGNRFWAPYFWGSTGVAYNVDMIRERLPGAPVDSSAMLLDPEVIKHFADCGVAFLDDAGTVMRVTLLYLGYDIDDTSEEAFEAVERQLKSVRPYIRYFESNRVAIDLSAGEVCLTMAWNGDYASGLKNAAAENLDVNLAYSVPKEGTNLWVDGWIIMADAPNPDYAHQFLNFLLEPEVIAVMSNEQRYPNAVLASRPLLIPEVIDDPAVTHPPEVMRRVHQRNAYDLYERRRVNRIWARVKAGFD
jgi:putrescine transport system substrate-binding protein